MIELTFGQGEVASQSNLFESPKAADPKCPLVATQSIDTRFIALKQPVLPQSLANEDVGRSDARIVSIPITAAGHEQHAGIDPVAVELSGIRLDLAIEASSFDQIRDRNALRFIGPQLFAELNDPHLLQRDQAVERRPTHNFRKGKMPPGTPHLPYAAVRLA